MTDPFSIAVGALAITQTCVKLTKTLIATRDALKNGPEEANDAVREISSLKLVCESVHLLCQKVNKDCEIPAIPLEDGSRLKQICGALSVSIGDCEHYMKTLELLFLRIYGPPDAHRTRKTIAQGVIKQLLKKNELQDVRRQIMTHHTNIQSQMASLSSFHQMIHTEATRKCLTVSQATNKSMQNLNASMHLMYAIIDKFLQPVTCSDFRPSLFGVHSISLVDVGTRYVHPRQISSRPSSVNGILLADGSYGYAQDSFSSGDQDEQSPTSVPSISHAASASQTQVRHSSVRSEGNTEDRINTYCNLPHAPSPIFVGRQGLLNELVDYLSSPSDGQKRVVISGLGGMGKTQLAIRVAVELRKLFFGIFWIDASSYEHIRAGWADIAKIFGLEPNYQAGLQYFASLKKPWLLIMDNADQLDALVEDFLPLNDLGCILLTTRDSAFTTRYSVGSPWKSYALTGISEREGAELLLLAARRKEPHRAADIETASQIAASLLCIPLALLQAGSYLTATSCKLEEYFELYQARAASFRISQRAQFSLTATLDQTFRISMQKLEKDALQILKLLPFFHADSIPTDIFFGTLRKYHSSLEGHAEMWDDEWIDAPPPITSPIIPYQLRSAINQLLQSPTLRRIFRTPAIMPDLLKSANSSTSVAEVRIQDALRNLERCGFIKWDSRKATFSVHRVLQDYVRKSVLSLGEEALNCEYVMAVLANCIKLEQQTFSRAVVSVEVRCLIPHIIDVRQRHLEVMSDYHSRRCQKRSYFGILNFNGPSFVDNGSDPLRLMKFATIYSSCGEYNQARILQEEAKALLMLVSPAMLSPRQVHCSAALALTYHHLHLSDKAIELQHQTIKASEALYGKEHSVTLGLMDMLGLFYLIRGDLSQSLRNCEEALKGFEKLYHDDPQQKTILTSLNHLGAVQGQHYRWKESKDLCALAMTRLEQVDPEGSEIWLARQNIAIANVHLKDSKAFEEAEHLMADVLAHWTETLGGEHPTTLLAVFNMSRVLLCRERIQEAKEILLAALATVESRLGNKDFGFLTAHVLAAQTLLAYIKIVQHDYAKAEQILIDVNDKYTETLFSSDHLERITVLWYLMECYKEQGRFDEALDIHEEMSDSLKAMMQFNMRRKHPLVKNLYAKRQELEVLKQAATIAASKALEARMDEERQAERNERHENEG